MEYHELVAACAHVVGAEPTSTKTLHDAMTCLMAHGPTNRAFATDAMARFMAEFIEARHGSKPTRH